VSADLKPKKNKDLRPPERSFGLSVGAVLVVLAGLLWWRHHPVRAELIGAVGAVLVTLGAIYPPLLKYPNAWWWRFARALGYVNARVLLTVVFALILTPLSFLWRLTGKDPLGRDRRRWTGWVPYPASHRDRTHFSRMY
jgi:hypothetical protein